VYVEIGVTTWLREVGVHTKADRVGRARKLTQRRVEVCSAMRRAGRSEVTIAAKAKWYDDRARGHYERIERVEVCGSELVSVSCQACGVCRERTVGCRAWMLCVRCRGATAAELRGRFLAARVEVLRRAQERGLFWRLRRGGAWGERFITLTVPHGATTVRGRIELAFAAWTPFLKLLNAHFRSIGVKSVEWLRVFEWTPGTDGLGHPHFHLWMFSQYIDHALLRDLWRKALGSAGCVIPEPIVHIEGVRDPSAAARELIKYMLKDISASGEKIPPDVFALVFAALAQRRIRQASKGFMSLAKCVAPCCECGAALPRRVRRKPKAPTEGQTST
jgi:hypothetical protein